MIPPYFEKICGVNLSERLHTHDLMNHFRLVQHPLPFIISASCEAFPGKCRKRTTCHVMPNMVLHDFDMSTFIRLHVVSSITCQQHVTFIDLAPLLVAPTPEGQWTDRAVTTTEAGKWLRNLLRTFLPSTEHTTIHTMKATPLSWCTKWGVDPYDRQLLGHHATGKASAECYGRDNLAKPLREFETVLQQIRTRAFVPDATRSGMMQTSEVTDPIENFQGTQPDDRALEGTENNEDSDLTSESDVQGPSTSSDEDDLDCVDSMSAPRQWAPDTTMYQNCKSKVVHVVAKGGAPSFSCGVQITSEYKEIAESAFLDIRRCRRCAIARPIKTVGQFASAYKKMRLGE